MKDIKDTLLDIIRDNTKDNSATVKAYNSLVEDSVIETMNTRTFQSTKRLTTRVDVKTSGVNFGNYEMQFENWYSLDDDTPLIDRYIKNKNKLSAFIVELKMAEREMKKQIDSYYEENSTPLKK